MARVTARIFRSTTTLRPKATAVPNTIGCVPVGFLLGLRAKPALGLPWSVNAIGSGAVSAAPVVFLFDPEGLRRENRAQRRKGRSSI
jgi:hypothetical protein